MIKRWYYENTYRYESNKILHNYIYLRMNHKIWLTSNVNNVKTQIVRYLGNRGNGYSCDSTSTELKN